MADTWALPELYAAVVDRFGDELIAVPNVFGWLEPEKKVVTGPRIVWYPGDPSRSMGDLTPPKWPGRNPRSLGTINELFTVECTSIDTADSSDLAQYIAARDLFDAWYRAAYLHATATLTVRSLEWVVPLARRAGACIRAVCSIEAMIPDTEASVLAAENRREIRVNELDVTEIIVQGEY